MSHVWVKLQHSNKGKAIFAKNLMGYVNRVNWDVFPYDFNNDDDNDDVDKFGATDSDVKSTLKTSQEHDKLDSTIFALFNVNSLKNKPDQLSDLIKGTYWFPNDVRI